MSVEAKLKDFNEEAYVESFRPHLMDVVHTWCKGATFGQICQMTDVFEGITGLLVLSSTHSGGLWLELLP